MITKYRFETIDNTYRIVEVRPDEELVVYTTAIEKKAKELYRRMKRGQCGFNGWTPKYLLT
jgi:predicted nucleotidyltransferase